MFTPSYYSIARDLCHSSYPVRLLFAGDLNISHWQKKLEELAKLPLHDKVGAHAKGDLAAIPWPARSKT